MCNYLRAAYLISFEYILKSGIVGLHANYHPLMKETEETQTWKHQQEVCWVYELKELILLKYV